MPWRVLIRHRDERPLGDLASVLEAIEEALPESFPYWMPGAARCVVEHVEESLLVRMIVEPEAEIDRIEVQVRGTGNPVPVLARLMRTTSWMAIDPTGRPIDVKRKKAPGWEEFLRIRLEVIRRMQEVWIGRRETSGE